MAICPRCGSSKSMAPGVLCPECLSSEELRETSGAPLTPDQPLTKPYGWGKVQGGLLILGSFSFLAGDQYAASPAVSVFSFALNLVLGACILRRNRLILPLMAFAILLLILLVIVASLNRDELGGAYAFGLVIWAFYAVYYYNRRSEFTRWL
jgi:hypothetical protein